MEVRFVVFAANLKQSNISSDCHYAMFLCHATHVFLSVPPPTNDDQFIQNTRGQNWEDRKKIMYIGVAAIFARLFGLREAMLCLTIAI